MCFTLTGAVTGIGAKGSFNALIDNAGLPP